MTIINYACSRVYITRSGDVQINALVRSKDSAVLLPVRFRKQDSSGPGNVLSTRHTLFTICFGRSVTFPGRVYTNVTEEYESNSFMSKLVYDVCHNEL